MLLGLRNASRFNVVLCGGPCSSSSAIRSVRASNRRICRSSASRLNSSESVSAAPIRTSNQLSTPRRRKSSEKPYKTVTGTTARMTKITSMRRVSRAPGWRSRNWATSRRILMPISTAKANSPILLVSSSIEYSAPNFAEFCIAPPINMSEPSSDTVRSATAPRAVARRFKGPLATETSRWTYTSPVKHRRWGSLALVEIRYRV